MWFQSHAYLTLGRTNAYATHARRPQVPLPPARRDDETTMGKSFWPPPVMSSQPTTMAEVELAGGSSSSPDEPDQQGVSEECEELQTVGEFELRISGVRPEGRRPATTRRFSSPSG